MTKMLALPLLLPLIVACASPDPVPVPSGGPEDLPADVLVAMGKGVEIRDGEEERLIKEAAEFYDLSAEKGRELWPDWDVRWMPLAVWEDPDRLLLINHDDAPLDMRAVNQRITSLPVYAGPCPPELRRTGVTELRGRPVAVSKAWKAGDFLGRLFHLAAHQFLQERLERPSSCHAFHVPALSGPDIEGRGLLEGLEAGILKRALEVPEEEVPAMAAFFLEVRMARRCLLPLEDNVWERRSESSEGVVIYTQIRIMASAKEGKEIIPETLDRGAAQAFLLDRLDPGWKEKFLEEGGPALEDLLLRSVEFLLMSGP